MVFILARVCRAAVSVGTLASLLPSILLILERKQHFELFVGTFQLWSGVCYSGSDALGLDRLFFVASSDWHRISDVRAKTNTKVMKQGLQQVNFR